MGGIVIIILLYADHSFSFVSIDSINFGGISSFIFHFGIYRSVTVYSERFDRFQFVRTSQQTVLG